MPIDLAAVDWLYVVILSVFVFVATLLANVLTFSHRGMAALLSALLFAAAFVFWTYYPHPYLPLPTTLATPKAAVPPPVAPVTPAMPVRPRNPVTDITPPPASPPPAAAPASPAPAR